MHDKWKGRQEPALELAGQRAWYSKLEKGQNEDIPSHMKWKVGAYLRMSSDLHLCTGAHMDTAFIHKCMHVCAIHMYISITQR